MINFIFIFALFFPQVWFTSLFFSFTDEKKPFFGTLCSLNTFPHTTDLMDTFVFTFHRWGLEGRLHAGGWTCHCWCPTGSVRTLSSTSLWRSIHRKITDEFEWTSQFWRGTCEGKQSKKKNNGEDLLIGPWIQRLHVADNGIDATCCGDSDVSHDERTATLTKCLQMIGQWVTALGYVIFTVSQCSRHCLEGLRL